ncbi:MAG TPA: ATP-binding protein, partial [Cyanophyceae cyanobacterium]
MNIPTNPSWYTANIQSLLASLQRVRQVLEDYINRTQNQPIPPKSGRELTPESLSILETTPSALDRLCNTFNLSVFERDILLLGVGMELDPNFEALCVKVHGNADRNYPTLGLALSILPEAHWRVLSSQSPLQQWQLIEIGEGQALAQSPIRINKRILCYLLSEPCLDDELTGILKPISTRNTGNSALPPSHQKLADQLVVTWSQSAVTSNFPLVQLCGSELAAKYAIIATACRNLGWNLNVISASLLPPNPNELNHVIQRCFREALLTNSALLLDCHEINQADAIRESVISQFIEGLNMPLIISSQERQRQRQRPLITLDVGQLSHNEQREIWQSYLGSVALELNGHIDTLVSQFNLSPSIIQTACLSVQTIDGSQSAIANHLWDFCRVQARPHLDDLAQRIDSAATWDDLVLPEQQKSILRDISTHVRQRTKVYQDWGFGKKGGRGLGISALFSGVSGTGKTMAAEVIANELHLDLYRIDLSAVVSKYIGETEKNLRRIFDAAEAGGAILLFDEADALFGKRTEVKDSHDRHANVEVSYLLQRMEAYQGLAILTTNLKGSLDQAFLRRIRFVISFPFPDATGRAEIWQRI